MRAKENDAKIIAEINEIADSPRSAIKASDPPQEPDAVLVQRKVPLYRGKWRMVSPEVEKSSAKCVHCHTPELNDTVGNTEMRNNAPVAPLVIVINRVLVPFDGADFTVDHLRQTRFEVVG
jgi:hypothetical protein